MQDLLPTEKPELRDGGNADDFRPTAQADIVRRALLVAFWIFLISFGLCFVGFSFGNYRNGYYHAPEHSLRVKLLLSLGFGLLMSLIAFAKVATE